MNKTISVSGASFTVNELKAFLASISDAPADVRVMVRHSLGDRPWDSTQYTLSATYRTSHGELEEK